MIKFSPCKDCIDRELGCHVVCEKYKKFRKEYEEEKEKILAIKRVQNQNISYIEYQSERRRRGSARCVFKW